MQLSQSVGTLSAQSGSIMLNMTGSVVAVLYFDSNSYGQAAYYDTGFAAPLVRAPLCCPALEFARLLDVISCGPVCATCQWDGRPYRHDCSKGYKHAVCRVLPSQHCQLREVFRWYSNHRHPVHLVRHTS